MQRDAAVHRVCVEASAHVFDVDAAVGGVDGEVCSSRHLQLEGDLPVALVVPAAAAAAFTFRSLGADPAIRDGDPDLLGQSLGGIATVVVHRDAGANSGV